MNKSTIIFGLACFFLAVLYHSIFSSNSYASVEILQFESQQQEQRYRNIISELRCVVCQNQNLADSHAPLAKDLRQITASMVREGKSVDEIKQFMVERYGEFVLYRPPINGATGLLWFGPFILLIFTFALTIRFIRSRQNPKSTDQDAHISNISKAERELVRSLLSDQNSDTRENTENHKDA